MPKVFINPSLRSESGEIERVAEYFGVDKQILHDIIHLQARNGEIVPLTVDLWTALENTDSNTIEVGDWASVAEHSSGRDWISLRDKLLSGIPLDAPVIVKVGNILHLVSGNTRLMVARAAGVIPHVLLVEVPPAKI